jgi:hypothetical protein
MSGEDSGGDRKESWRRIRVGLTGLGGILLLIGLASAMLERISPRTPEPVAVADGLLGNSVQAPESEPLAELGVAPGAAEPTQGSKPAAK